MVVACVRRKCRQLVSVCRTGAPAECGLVARREGDGDGVEKRPLCEREIGLGRFKLGSPGGECRSS
jgi:hypothetical protein